MRSVLPQNSKLILLFAAVIVACTSPGRRDLYEDTGTGGQTILNLRLSNSYGPVLETGVSLQEPSSAAFNRIGELFVSDRITNGIYRFSADYNFISSEGGIGSVTGSFNRPGGIACDPALNLYVADSGNKRVQILDRNLRRVRSIESYFDENNNSVNFTRPDDIAIDREGNFWIADNDRVLKLDPFYELLFEMSYDAPGNFRIGRVSSIDISNRDLIAVADPGNQQVIIATIHGNYVTDFPAGKSSCIRWDNSGLLWLADPTAGKIEVFDKKGNMVFRYMENMSGFRPTWLTFDLSGRLIVLDAGQRRIFLYDIIRGAK